MKPSGKTKQCKAEGCDVRFTPSRPMQKACSPMCGIALARQKEQAKQAKERRRDTRKRKEAIKTRSDVLKEAQAAFNAWVRERDRDDPCISCGGRPCDGRLITGSYWHASHYRSVGACSYLRFDEDNVHAACSVCNSHKAGNILEYRIGLIRKIGEARVERLERAPKMYKWTKEEAQQIRDTYRKRWRELRREREE